MLKKYQNLLSTAAGIKPGQRKVLLASSAAIAISVSITACDAFSTDTKTEDEIQINPKVLRGADAESRLAGSGALADSSEKIVEVQAAYKADGNETIAVTGSDAVPYPIYPGATQYRVGGENGLNVVLFETSDSFKQVDEFYQRYTDSEGYSRLVGMSDYVRYDANISPGSSVVDAWSTDRAGIVLHGFVNSTDAKQFGADASARTNIIVSY